MTNNSVEQAIGTEKAEIGQTTADERVRIDVLKSTREDTERMLKHILPEEIKIHAIHALSANGITNRRTLISTHPAIFVRLNFSDFGKGITFASRVLGEKIKYIAISTLERIADEMGFPKITEEEKKQEYISILANHGITDRQSLLRFGAQRFVQIPFPPFKKGRTLAGAILGKTIGRITNQALEQIADVLFGK